ncbi:MAG: glutaconate CoA-transferase subunit B [Peptoniphilus sp.]|uniref:Glutaconate CoA-transferase subunit B n=2 Tax=Peptoniphilus indolicus TaxID=33030 RepID=G4D2G0_9FIRM|nr:MULTISPECIES: glutaconate CoA-transferase subunit B [Peptoniphilus]EGY80291.1 glutaconate CoA-transferase subunit B [Peptoniphilus indolicus ATCC 29427]MDY2987502.1 glutaconate CoA-transferase subunit B [Peptoniphilus sp.]SUB75329.1 Glutaconate CoA-transferase subunit B [Peptoniphilus indolicus]
MARYDNYTNKEMQAVTIARQIKNDQIVIVGTGLPLIGASVAKRAFAPECQIIVESGLMDCSPIEVPRSVGDNRFMAQCAVQWPNVRFIGFEACEWLHNKERMIAFIGGAQIDPYGNVNSTVIGDYNNPKTRFTGSGGANGIASYVNTVIMMQHEKRRFMEKIDYITSPGWMDGPGGRTRAGIPENVGPQMVVTDRGILKFDEETKKMYLAGYYPTSSPEDVLENTGFDIDVSRAVLLEAPDESVIKLIREEIDPGEAFIKVPVEE